MRRATIALSVIFTFFLTVLVLKAALLPVVATGQWQPAANLNESRDGAASVLLQNGSILVTGGASTGGASTGGASTAGASLTAEVFGTDGSMNYVSPMTTARSRHTATLLDDGRVLVVGGDTGGGAATNSAEIYNPGSNSWSSAGTLIDARFGHTATLLEDGRVLIAGGENGGTVATLEIYDPTSNAFSPAAEERRGQHPG
jgi:large repetitive protein